MKKSPLPFLIGLLFVAGPAPDIACAGGFEKPSAIIAERYVAPDGSLVSPAVIFLKDGKISDVHAAQVHMAKALVAEFPGAVICPGLIDLRSALGAHENNIETAFAVDPGASAVDVLDHSHRDFRAAIEAGITTVLISPSTNNLISGTAAVTRTAVVSGNSPVLRADGPLVFTLGPGVWEEDRAPTSRIGMMAMLRDALDSARQGQGHARTIAFAHGRLDGLVVCETALDIGAALQTFEMVEGRSISLHVGADVPEIEEFTEELSAAGVPVVVGPYTFGMSPRILGGAAALSNAGIPVAFAAETPLHPGATLRTTAALAVRYGMAPNRARAAMTSTAAGIAGIGDRIGAIQKGLEGDLVVFSDDPLRLNARVLAVYIRGVRVYGASQSNAMPLGERP